MTAIEILQSTLTCSSVAWRSARSPAWTAPRRSTRSSATSSSARSRCSLLDLGVIAARRAGGLRSAGPGLLVLGTCMPLVNGTLAVAIATAAGLSVGGTALVGIMAAGASYIAAPAAVRVALPDANPALHLTASLGITFLLNLVVGILLFFAMARAIGA